MYCIQEGFIGNATQKVALLWDLPVSCVTDINSFREAFYMQLLQESSALASRVSQRVEGLLSGSVESAFANSPDLSSSTPPESGSDFPDMDS